jgi:gamma-glutamylcyclotransferase (GGCT)/AIG2-like uncharacterized protein YtfP
MLPPVTVAQLPRTPRVCVVIERLFVYGTLAPGRPNAYLLADVRGEWEPATVRGRLLQEGWGATAGYPALALDEYGPQVRGLLFSSEKLSDHWERLDEFEGDGYERVVTTVQVEGGRFLEANVYVARGAPPAEPAP